MGLHIVLCAMILFGSMVSSNASNSMEPNPDDAANSMEPNHDDSDEQKRSEDDIEMKLAKLVKSLDMVDDHDEKLRRHEETIQTLHKRIEQSCEASCVTSGGGPSVKVGHEVKDRPVVDTAGHWTMVPKSISFEKDGTLTGIEVYSKMANREIRIGLFRPAGAICTLKLIHQWTFKSIAPGKHTLALSPTYPVKAGDRLGHTWYNFGVIPFSYMYRTIQNYCEAHLKPNVGSTNYYYGYRHGNREYSLQGIYTPTS